MKSLLDSNELRRAQWALNNLFTPKPNGIACPECGEELIDSTPHITHQFSNTKVYPPEKDVSCPGCGYAGRRVV